MLDSAITYALHFLLGASWGVFVLGALFLPQILPNLNYFFAAFLGVLPGLLLVIVFYLLLHVREVNAKIRDNRS